MVFLPSCDGLRTASLGDAAGGALVDAGAAVDALVDAGAAVDAFASVDDCDVLAGDSALGADVHACSACDTLRSVDCNHLDYL